MLTWERIGYEAMPERRSIGVSVTADLMTWPVHRLGTCESCSHRSPHVNHALIVSYCAI